MKKRTIPIERAVEIAAEMHRAGQYERAQQMYVEILRQDPANVDAIHLLGVLAFQGGRPEVAVELISRAMSRRPDEPLILCNYADALAANKQPEEAIKHYRRALEIVPEHLGALNNLSRTLHDSKRYEEAVEVSRKAIEIDPKNAVAQNHLGNSLHAMVRNDEAIPHFQAAIDADPQFVEAVNNLGLALVGIGKIDDGVEKLREAIRMRPEMAGPYINLGVMLSTLQRHSEALTALETAVKLDPKSKEARNMLSGVLRAAGRLPDSLEELKELEKIDPEYWPMQINFAHTYKELGRSQDALDALDKFLESQEGEPYATYLRGLMLRDLHRPDEAIDAFRYTLEKVGNRPEILATLGYALQERGELDEAMEALLTSISLQSDPSTHSNVMMVMCYHPDVSPQKHFEAHRVFAMQHEEPLKRSWKPHTNVRDPNRRLKVGYFSPDLRSHVVSYFSTPIFENHNHDNFEIFAYSNNYQADAMTIIQRAKFDHWRETAGMPANKIAELIREDGIDILIELAGHTGGNGMPVLMRKPAPIQINAIGFPSTTGLTSVDYRVTDRICDPPGIAEAHNSEKLLYMPDCFWVYQPPIEEIDVGPLPADRNGHVTFVSVNNFTKVTPQVLARWAQILARIPSSKIILQTNGLASEFVQNRVREIFGKEGVSDDRIDMRKVTPFNTYLRLLESCDIMLDPFPFNGGTTSCHGLWMGNALVTLEGQMHAGRMGMSMLHCIGLSELCGVDEQAYVKIAVDLANDLPRLRNIRAGMRERLLASPLLDAPRYVKNLESAYRDIWKTYCAQNPAE